MVTQYTEHQEAIRKMVRDFAVKEVAPGAEERDRTGEFDYQLYRRLGELGVTGIMAPEEYGGSDAGYLAWNLAIEELARVDASLTLTAFVGSSAVGLLRTATDEQKEKWADKWLLPIMRAEAVAAGAITEPDAGSDTRAIKTTAVLDGEEWVVNGSKTYITNAGLDNCVFVMVVCLTDKDGTGFSNVIVPTGTPGYTIMPKFGKMGIRSSDTRELHFDNCRVPAMNLQGMGGAGRRYIVNEAFVTGRITTATVAMGIHQACLDESLTYAQQRVAFGKPIYSFSGGDAYLTNDRTLYERGLLAGQHPTVIQGLAEDPDVRKYASMGGTGDNMRAVGATEAMRQLLDADVRTDARIRNCDYLTQRLSELPGITPPYVRPGYKHVYHYYNCLWDADQWGVSRDRFLQALNAAYKLP